MSKASSRFNVRSLVFFGIVEVVSLLCAIILISERPSSPYEQLFILPLAHSIITLLFIELYDYSSNSLVCFIALACLFIKNTLTPFVMVLGNFYTYFGLISSEDVNYAIALMLWDTFCISSLLLAYRRGIFSIFTRRVSIKSIISERTFKYITGALILFCVVISFVDPSVRSGFVSIFSGNAFQENGLAVNTYNIGSSGRVFYTLFMFFFPILQLVLTSYLMLLVKRRFGDTYFSVVLSVVLVLCQGFFMNGSDGWTIILIAALLVAMYRSFPHHRIFVLKLSIVIVVMAALLVYLSKTSSYSVFDGKGRNETLSFMLQAYFPGVANTAGVFYAPLSDRLRSFLYDCYYTIPFRNSIFGLPGDYRAVIEYTATNAAASSVLPCVGQCYYYLGPVLAPLFSCILLFIALNCEKSLNIMTSPLISAGSALLMLYAALSPFMYNMTIFGMRFLFTLLPVLLLSRCASEETWSGQILRNRNAK